VRLGLVIALAGCGRIAFDDLAPDSACTWTAFSTPAPLPGPVQSAQDDWEPTPTLGGLELYFYSFRNGSNADIYVATRPSLAGAFNAPVAETELNTIADEGSTTLTDDADDVIFERDGDLFEARRASPSVPFDPPALVTELNTPSAEGSPFETADGLRIVFASSRIGPDSEGLDLFEATRPSLADPFTAPVELAPLTSSVDDFSPTLSADGLDIFFASLRPGGPGGADIYTSHRGALDQPFAAPVLVPELSSAIDDVGVRLSRDGTTMFMSYATLTVGGANADLDSATRSCR
jgi:hypothetical protein